MLKALLANPIFQFLIGRSMGLYMLLVGWTTRWRAVNQAAVQPAWDSGQTKIIACVWHGRFMLAHRLWAFARHIPQARMLISRSREGGVVTEAARMVGADVVRGSAAKRGQQKGGVEATLEMMRVLDADAMVCMTPDGPRGPRMRARLGPVQVAKMAQAPLLPMAWSTRWRFVFQSWDRFMLPLPFGRGALIWGDLIAPPSPDADAVEMEQVRALLETELNRVTAEADRWVGGAIIAPHEARADAEFAAP